MPEFELASPLEVIEDVDRAKEALFLTYGAQLGFFERYALSAARALGARVSVVADASRVLVDVEAIRRAGRRYLDGRVDLAGRAFHPKLLVLAGTETATVMIGSANLTLGGWHGNAEIWSVLRGQQGRGPRALGALAPFLRSLPEVAAMGPGVEDALRRAADLLADLGATDPGPELVDSVRGPVVEQLPVGPVEELHLHAPFFDHDLRAIEALCERLQPQRLDLYVHPDTSVDGPALERFLSGRKAAWRLIADRRYHHGKLIEWVKDGRRLALTGSPNLSAPALLSSAGDGGNVELGLVTEVESSLAPATSAGGNFSLGAWKLAERQASRPEILLLGAAIEGDEIQLFLARPLAQSATVEVRFAGRWSKQATVPAGVREPSVAIEQTLDPAGAPLRISSGDERFSNTVFVTDLDAVKRPQVDRIGRTQTDPIEIFADLAIAKAFAEDLARLRLALGKTGAGGDGGAAPAGAARGNPPSEKLTVDEYLERCGSAVGETMVRFGLGLPFLPLAGPGAGTSGPAGDEPSNGEGEEDDPDAVEGPRRAIRDLSTRRRNRYRAWFRELFVLAPSLPLAGQLIVFNLTIQAAAGGLWDEPGEWVGELADVACSLATTEPDSEVDAAARALSGLTALLLLDAHVQRWAGSDPARDALDRLAATLRGGRLLDEMAEANALAASDTLRLFGRHLYEGDVAEVLARVGRPPDPLERAAAALQADFDLDAEVEDGELRIVGLQRPLRDPLLFSVASADTDRPLVVRAATPRGSIAVIWSRPRLLVLRDTPRGWGGDLYRLRDRLRVPATRSEVCELPKPSSSWMPGEAVPSEAAELLQHAPAEMVR